MTDYVKNILIEEVNNQVTIDDIRKVEKELSVNFPEDYKKHILKYNGGHSVKNSYPIIEIYDFDYEARAPFGGTIAGAKRRHGSQICYKKIYLIKF